MNFRERMLMGVFGEFCRVCRGWGVGGTSVGRVGWHLM